MTASPVPGTAEARQFIEYRADIDGLRAVAVLGVVVYHLDAGWLPGGYLGVDVFFVISGYLITSILRSELERGRFTYVGFLDRRARRILPPLIFVVLLAGPMAAWLSTPEELRALGHELISIAGFVSNYYFALDQDYFAQDAGNRPFLHSWSLAVEEQFYLLMPLGLLALWRIRWQSAGWVLATLGLASLGSAVLLGDRFPELTFYGLHARAWELLLGAWLAFARVDARLAGAPSWVPALAAILGFASIAAAFVFNVGGGQTPITGQLAATLGAALLIACPWSGSAALLSRAPMVHIGLISYSAYLWHFPLVVLADRIVSDAHLLWKAVGVLVLTGLFAELSWRFVEQPFRQRKIRWHRARELVPAFVLLVAGLGGAMTATVLMPAPGASADRFAGDDSLYGGRGTEWGLKFHGDAGPVALRVYGDSHARQYLNALRELGTTRGARVESLTHRACFSLPGATNIYQETVHPSCIALYEKLLERTRIDPAPVMIAHRWSKNIATPDGTVIGRTGEDAAATEHLLRSLDAFLAEISAQVPVLLVGNVPASNLHEYRGYRGCVRRIDADCPLRFPREAGESRELNLRLGELASRHPGVTFIDPYEALCDEAVCHVAIGDALVYSDHAHLSLFGARRVVRRFADVLITAPRGTPGM